MTGKQAKAAWSKNRAAFIGGALGMVEADIEAAIETLYPTDKLIDHIGDA